MADVTRFGIERQLMLQWSDVPSSMVGRTISVLIAYGCLLAGGWLVGSWIIQLANIDAAAMGRPGLVVVAALLLFVLTSALPFVPGAEIGLMLMICFGKPLVLPVYLCMLTALIIAYLAGRFVPLSAVSHWFALLGLTRASALTTRLANGEAVLRYQCPSGTRQGRIVSMLLKNRFVALMVLLNVPGNSVAGGGGGIAFAAGASGLYSARGFLVAILLAIAPVPLFFYLTS